MCYLMFLFKTHSYLCILEVFVKVNSHCFVKTLREVCLLCLKNVLK